MEFLFHPDLVNPSSVERVSRVSGTRRLIFRNQAAEHQFWIETLDTHAAKVVTVDIHDRDLKSENLNTLANFLSASHGNFGLVIGCNFSNLLQTIPVFILNNSQKAILVITDSELEDMLAYKAGGINPVCLIEDLYQDLIISVMNTECMFMPFYNSKELFLLITNRP